MFQKDFRCLLCQFRNECSFSQFCSTQNFYSLVTKFCRIFTIDTSSFFFCSLAFISLAVPSLRSKFGCIFIQTSYLSYFLTIAWRNPASLRVCNCFLHSFFILEETELLQLTLYFLHVSALPNVAWLALIRRISSLLSIMLHCKRVKSSSNIVCLGSENINFGKNILQEQI